MREDATKLEDERLRGLELDSYPWYHERHRIFPEIFGKQRYSRILDTAAGMGVVAKRIQENYPCYLLCNDISSESIKNLRASNFNVISFDLDRKNDHFPFKDETFDAVLSLATLEHIINLDQHMYEIRRILKRRGHLFMSVPNYSGLQFVIPFLIHGRSFHNPLKGGISKYEFYAHVRYFTYKTLIEFVSQFGFKPDTVYLPLPKESSRFRKLKGKSEVLAKIFKLIMFVFYKCLPPRWAFHPVIRFSRWEGENVKKVGKPQKVIL
jgi:SAM-dependent methyltransferase